MAHAKWRAASDTAVRRSPVYAASACVLLMGLQAFAASPTSQQPAYCSSGSTVFLMDTSGSALQTFYQKCFVGDIAGIPGRLAAVIAQVCDFAKPMHAGPDGFTLCVIGPLKPIK